MKIKTILFNFLLLLFLGILIYIYMYINNGTYEGFEGRIVMNTESIDNLIPIIKKDPTTIKPVRDGSAPNLALISAKHLLFINSYTNVDDSSSKNLGNGYYWINVPVVGPKYIFCISNPDFFGGGWMLAMRSFMNSKTFNYASKHWTCNSTLNASSAEIKQLLPTLLGTRDRTITPLQQFDAEDINNNYKNKFEISSVGNNLYMDNVYVPSARDINNFDCKLDTYNYFRTREIMIVFYIADVEKLPQLSVFCDGEKPNKIGWVWTATIDPINYNNAINTIQPTLLELFQYLDTSDVQNLRASTNAVMEFAKFKGTQSASPVWFSTMPDKNGKAFYGFNYKIGKVGARFGFSFGTSDEITSVNGVGLAYEDKNTDYSGGRSIKLTAKSDANSAPNLSQGVISDKNYFANTISYEIYVR
jgi:hypothetical protein